MGHDRLVKLRVLVALVLFCTASSAGAQCSRGPVTAEVTLPGLFAVYYQQFRSSAEQDTAEFYGGVCVTAVGGEWTVMAQDVTVGNLTTDIYLVAPDPTLYLEGWRMTGASLMANAEGLTLTRAALVGPDVSGHASELKVDLTTGSFTLTDLTLTGTAFEVAGALATLQNDVLRVEDASVTTCIGLASAPFALEGKVATVELATREVKVDGGALRVGNLLVPLRGTLTLSDKTLSELEFPVKVAVVEPSPGVPLPTPGAGLSVRVVNIPIADDVSLELGATGLDPGQDVLPIALIRAFAATDDLAASGSFGLEAGAPYLDFALTKPITEWLQGSMTITSGAAPARRARHEGRVGLVATTAMPALNGRLEAEALAAVTAITAVAGAAQPEVAGPRLGVRVSASAATPDLRSGGVPLGTLSLDGNFQAMHYPGVWGLAAPAGPATQWGVRLAPSWRLSSGPLAVVLAYDARFTNSASPFGTAVDRLTPLQRATGSASLTGPLTESLSGRLGLAVTYDAFATPTVPAGFKRLRADGRLSLDAPPWTVTLTTAFEAAGLMNALPAVPAFVSADVALERRGWQLLGTHVPAGAFEFGVGVEYDLLASALTRVETRMGLPIAYDLLELRPFVAVDFAHLMHGGAPYLSGYGLDLTFITCCGSLTLGAINDRGKWGASIAVDLERRPGAAGAARPATAPAPVDEGVPATGNEAEPGIMPPTP